MTPFPDSPQSHRLTDDAPNGTPAIETHGLSKHYGQRKAVDGLTISIPTGTIAGFVGPNGAGKTTTFACCWDWCDQLKAVPGFDPRSHDRWPDCRHPCAPCHQTTQVEIDQNSAH